MAKVRVMVVMGRKQSDMDDKRGDSGELVMVLCGRFEINESMVKPLLLQSLTNSLQSVVLHKTHYKTTINFFVVNLS